MSHYRLLLLSKGLGAIPDFLPSPAVLGFVPTAGVPYRDPYFVREDRVRLEKMGYEVVDLDLSVATPTSLESELSRLDGIFVAGGNTFFLLQEIQRRNLDGVIKAAVLGGLAYIGVSAGALIAGPTTEPRQTLDDLAAAPQLQDWRALGLVEFVVLPHFGRAKYQSAYDEMESSYGGRLDLRELRDDQGYLVEDVSEPVLIQSAIILHGS